MTYPYYNISVFLSKLFEKIHYFFESHFPLTGLRSIFKYTPKNKLKSVSKKSKFFVYTQLVYILWWCKEGLSIVQGEYLFHEKTTTHWSYTHGGGVYSIVVSSNLFQKTRTTVDPLLLLITSILVKAFRLDRGS